MLVVDRCSFACLKKKALVIGDLQVEFQAEEREEWYETKMGRRAASAPR
jgi:hypothetical protein